jgi:hypothetical protein
MIADLRQRAEILFTILTFGILYTTLQIQIYTNILRQQICHQLTFLVIYYTFPEFSWKFGKLFIKAETTNFFLNFYTGTWPTTYCTVGCTVGWFDIGIRTTVRLGKVNFVAKVCKICLKTFLVHWPLPDRCTLLGPCSTYGSKMMFSQYRVYGYQKTQNFT